jgi:hypothetical protein
MTFPPPEAPLRKSIVTLAALLLITQLCLATQLCPAALAQEEEEEQVKAETKQPAFTLHSRVNML